MRHIPPLRLQDNKQLREIAEAKAPPRQAILLDLGPTTKAAYRAYVAAAPAVNTAPAVALDDDQCEALHHAFSVVTAPMTELREKLLDRVVAAICPFCGVGESTTLDHYLPKETYPVYSVFSRNLVPCCPKCNSHKHTLVIDEAVQARAFLHPYYDTVPQDRFLHLAATLRPRSLDLSFTISRPAGFEDAAFAQINSHFARLQLARRYRLRSLSHLRDKLPGFRRWFVRGGAERVASELNDEVDDLTQSLGQNHWNVLLYETLAANYPFCAEGFEVLETMARQAV